MTSSVLQLTVDLVVVQGGGGVAIYVKEKPDYKVIPLDTAEYSITSIIETTGVKLKFIDGKEIIVIGIYRPPTESDCSLALESRMEMLIKFIETNTKVIIAGDFNIDFLKRTSRSTINLYGILHAFNIVPVIEQCTRVAKDSQTCIDNVCTNMPSIDSAIVTTGISDHYAQLVKLRVNNVALKLPKIENYVRNLSKDNIDVLNLLLTNEEWTEVFESDDPNVAIEKFIETFKHHYEISCPGRWKRSKPKQNRTEWFTQELSNKKESIDFLIELNRKHDSDDLSSQIKKLKKEYVKSLNLSRKMYNDKKITR